VVGVDTGCCAAVQGVVGVYQVIVLIQAFNVLARCTDVASILFVAWQVVVGSAQHCNSAVANLLATLNS
jgi:hypothetical protein